MLIRSTYATFIALLITLALPTLANATTLYSFTGGSDGATPQSSLDQKDDASFLGTTSFGGVYGAGTVFRLKPDGTLKWAYSFGSQSGDGSCPIAQLVEDGNGDFYGTTYLGGTGFGTVYKITSKGDEKTLYSFTGGSDGGYSWSALVIGCDGDLYGTTPSGGDYGYGTVFRMTRSGSLKWVYSFGAQSGDGAYPISPVVQASDGSFYGTTVNGGANGFFSGSAGFGTIFRITPNGTLTTLYSFAGGLDGAYPWDGLAQATDGSLYGTTPSYGAYGNGTVFKTTLSGSVTPLYSFGTQSGDGANPLDALIIGNDGNLYGTTQWGGAETPAPFSK